MRNSTAVLLIAATLVAPAASSAQENRSAEERDVHLRNDCRLARQAIETGHPSPHYEWATRVIQACDATGPDVLVDLWASQPDSSDLEWMAVASRELRDRRILEAMLEVAGDDSGPTLLRLSAMRVLATLGNSLLVPALVELRVDPSGRQRLPATRSHSGGRAGAQPLPDRTLEMVLDLFTELQDGSSDAEVRVAAGRLGRMLKAMKAAAAGTSAPL